MPSTGVGFRNASSGSTAADWVDITRRDEPDAGRGIPDRRLSCLAWAVDGTSEKDIIRRGVGGIGRGGMEEHGDFRDETE